MDGTGDDRGRLLTFDTQTNKRTFGLAEESCDQLLPGILDEITLNEIVPKLSWSAFCVLPRVSRGWQQAVQSRHARLNETFVVIVHGISPEVAEICLYSMRDKCCYRLPPIPDLPEGIPRWCQCIALDGKLYVMGGSEQITGCVGEENLTDVNVYVFDMAARRQWKQCASMKQARQNFGCGVMNGKIYVFGGRLSDRECLTNSEVYDPTTNTWSWIPPMSYRRCFNQVAPIGEALFVYGRSCQGKIHIRGGLSVHVYHPLKNEWTVIDPFREELGRVSLFMARGKLHSIGQHGISVHDFQKNTWTHLQRLPTIDQAINPILGVDDELLVRSYWYDSVTKCEHLRLFQSKGFGSKKKELVWEEANSSIKLPTPGFPCLFQT